MRMEKQQKEQQQLQNNDEFESGTSLAAMEYDILNTNSGTTTTTTTKISTTTTNFLLSNYNISDKNVVVNLKTSSTTTRTMIRDAIEDLRTQIVMDILQDHHNNNNTSSGSGSGSSSVSGSRCCNRTTFSSPFERRRHNHNKKQQKDVLSSSTSTTSLSYQVPLLYCDQTASNQIVVSLEKYLYQQCLPYYGNTHTTTSRTGSQSTAFVHESRQMIAEWTNAKITGKASTDIVLFTGNGATAAVELLIDCLGLKYTKWNRTDSTSMTTSSSATVPVDDNTNLNNDNNLKDEDHSSSSISTSTIDMERPIIFIGPYEHHSNLIPWRETGCEIIMIPECSRTGTVDLMTLEKLLQHEQTKERQQQPHQPQRRLKIGTFTAASNVTGIVSNVHAIAHLLHQYGALCFIDYATAAPYMKINMNPIPIMNNNNNHNKNKSHSNTNDEGSTDDTTNNNKMIDNNLSLSYLDGIFMSPHKMIGGGGGTCGVLIMKKTLFDPSNTIPNKSGGGTVFYVTNEHHRFLSNKMERYEGGSPNVASIVRTGLVFLYQRQIHERYNTIVSNVPKAIMTTTTTTKNTLSDSVKDKETMESVEIILEQNPRTTIPQSIQDYEFMTFNKVTSYLQSNAPNLILLGRRDPSEPNQPVQVQFQQQQQHLPIFSFLIRYGQRFLHYNYVCAILNDVFGIQSRGGCQCAGPYSQRLLGLNEVDHETKLEIPNQTNRDIENALIRYKERAELLRPGYTRISLPFKGCNEMIVQYVMDALVWISKNGWALMCQYRCNHRTGEWRHSSRQGKPLGTVERRWLSHYNALDHSHSESNIFTNVDNLSSSTATNESSHDTMESLLKECMNNANEILSFAKSDHRSIVEASKMVEADLILGHDTDDAKLEELRWYVYPKECATILLSSISTTDTHHHTEDLKPLEYVGALHPNAELKYTSTDLQIKKDTNTTETPLPSNDQFITNSTTSGTEINEKKRKVNIITPIINESSPDQKNASNSLTVPSDVVSTVSKKDKKTHRDSSLWGQSSSAVTTSGKPMSTPTLNDNETSGKIDSNLPNTKKKNKFRHQKPSPKIMRLATQAIIQWDMIKEGDRLLLGLSGGKDSLTLLHCLLEFRRILPIKFEIEVCTIDPMTPSFDPSPLIPYVESLGLKYHYIKDNIVERANKSGKDGKIVASLCAFCARMKRGNLYSCARTNQCNKLVLAQHLDDCAESFMMSVMHNGFLRTMKAHYEIDAGDLAVIRPLIYCRESLMTDFAKMNGLPVINENCPACFEEPKERARIKKMLSREETMHPNFYDSIKRSLLPLMHDDLAPIMRGYTEEIVSKSRVTKGVRIEKNGTNRNTNTKKNETNGAQVVNAADTIHANSTLSIGDGNGVKKQLSDYSDEDLVLELARRKARKFQETKRLCNDDDGTGIPDPTGQMCSLNGGNGTIPCRELME